MCSGNYDIHSFMTYDNMCSERNLIAVSLFLQNFQARWHSLTQDRDKRDNFEIVLRSLIGWLTLIVSSDWLKINFCSSLGKSKKIQKCCLLLSRHSDRDNEMCSQCIWTISDISLDAQKLMCPPIICYLFRVQRLFGRFRFRNVFQKLQS